LESQNVSDIKQSDNDAGGKLPQSADYTSHILQLEEKVQGVTAKVIIN